MFIFAFPWWLIILSIFSSIHWPFFISLWKVFGLNICYFFIGLFVLLLLNCKSASWFWKQVFCQIKWKWKLLSRVWFFATPWTIYSLWNFSGGNTGEDSLSLLQGIFPTQGSNPDLPHCRWIFASWATREALSDIHVANIPVPSFSFS